MFEVHFLSPFWLLLIPIGLLVLYGFYRFYRSQWQGRNNWDELVDKPLQPFVISGRKEQKHRQLLFLFVVGLLAILSLSGPSFHKVKVPLYEANQGLVIALDLSSSMLAQDIKPNRIQRAKLALIDLLKPDVTEGGTELLASYHGYVGLLVFAGEAFTVSPLTNDVDTIFAQLTHMSPKIMPSQGSRLDKAINQSVNLLVNAGYHEGKILLVTDGMNDLGVTKKAAKAAFNKGFEVSVLAIGTATGGTIPFRNNKGDGTQVLLNQQGKAVIASLNIEALVAVADAGNGIFLDLNTDQNITDTLLTQYQEDIKFESKDAEDSDADQNVIEYWKNTGVWLLFPLLFMILYLFRRGLIWVLCFIVLFPVDPVYAFDWNSLWLNQEQQAKQMLEKGEADKAQQLFSDNRWKAAAAYKARNYQLAVQLFSEQDTATAWYNKGNSYFMLEEWAKAMHAYEVVLKKQPQHKDAIYNLQLAKMAQQALTHAVSKETSVQQMDESSEGASQHESSEMTDKQSLELDIQKFSIQQKEQRSYEKQWLKSVPDDPSGLWRRKFKYQYQKGSQQPEAQPW